MNKDKWLAVLRGAAVAAVGAVLTYATQWATNADFGQWTPLVVAVLSVLTNFVRKLPEKPKGEEDHVSSDTQAE